MKIKQLSIFIENQPGRLYKALEILAQENINIRALSLADTSEFAILRLVVNSPENGKEILEKNNCGVFSHAGNMPEFVDAIKALAADPSRCEEMGRNAAAYYEKHFVKEKCLDKLDKLMGISKDDNENK